MEKDRILEQLGGLERVEGVLALPPGSRSAAAAGPESADYAPFRQAGWQFVPPEGEEGHAVYRDRDGRLKIGTGALNVRFGSSVPADEVQRILAEHGLSVRRKLGFQPNLFLVGPQSGAAPDAVAMARDLTTTEAVDYAEPVLIEDLSDRRVGR